MSDNRPVRQPSAVDRVAEDWVTTLVDLDPTVATYIGAPGRTDGYGDTSPAGADALADAARAARRTLDATDAVDAVDRVTKTDLGAELDLVVESHDRRLHLRDLNVIQSPAQELRDVLDLMPTATTDDWQDVAGRLHALPEALEGHRETLLQGTREQVTPARRQVALVAEQAARNGAEDGFFRQLVDGATLEGGGPLPESLRSELARGAEVAAAAYRSFGGFLEHELLPLATPVDAVGREDYELHSRRFLGRSWTSTRRTSGGSRSSPGCARSRSASPTASSPARRWPGRSRSSTPTRPASCTARTPCSGGCRRRATPRSARWTGPTSTSPTRSSDWSAGSPPPRRAASTTPARPTTSRGPAGCGGRCRRA